MALTQQQIDAVRNSLQAKQTTDTSGTASGGLTSEQIQAVRDKLSQKQAVTTTTPVEGKKPFLQKASDIAEKKFLKPLTESLVSPVAREVIRPFVSGVRGVQGMIPGGKQGTEPVKTPFGDVRPYSELSSKEAVMGAVEVASFLPVEKLFVQPLKLLGKVGQKALSGTGEVLTGVPKEKLSQWFNLARENPNKIERVKTMVKRNPQEPFLGLADEVGTKINELKEAARESFTKAVDISKEKYIDTTFNLENKLPELNETLNQFRLTVNQAKEKGKFLSKAVVTPTTRTSPFEEKEIKMVNQLVGKLRTKNMSVDELLDFDESVKQFLNNAVRTENKRLVALGSRLVEQSTKFVDEVLPEVAEANKQYRDYYKVAGTIGKNLLDKSGQVKKGAESYIGNLMNMNKGVARQEAIDASRLLGLDIVDEASNIKTAKELFELVPQTTKNRTMDAVRAIVSGKFLGEGGSIAGKAGLAGAGILNPALLPALLVNIFSSPNAYRGLVEVIASKKPLADLIKTMKPEEIVAIRKLISDVAGVPLKEETDQDSEE